MHKDRVCIDIHLCINPKHPLYMCMCDRVPCVHTYRGSIYAHIRTHTCMCDRVRCELGTCLFQLTTARSCVFMLMPFCFVVSVDGFKSCERVGRNPDYLCLLCVLVYVCLWVCMRAFLMRWCLHASACVRVHVQA